jgi:hypothetical protein
MLGALLIVVSASLVSGCATEDSASGVSSSSYAVAPVEESAGDDQLETPGITACVEDLVARSKALAESLGDATDVDAVTDDDYEVMCREVVIPGQADAAARADAGSDLAEGAVSSACDQAMRLAADEPDSSAAQPLLDATTSACMTAAEWLTALRRYPAALGIADMKYVADSDVDLICYANGSAPMCAGRP